jgi:hypothetical protein
MDELARKGILKPLLVNNLRSPEEFLAENFKQVF